MGQQPWSWGGEGICGAELLLHLAGGREVNGWASTILTGIKASNINSTKAEKPRSKTRNQITSNQLFFFFNCELWKSRIWVLDPQSHWEARARLPPSPSWQRVLKGAFRFEMCNESLTGLYSMVFLWCFLNPWAALPCRHKHSAVNPRGTHARCLAHTSSWFLYTICHPVSPFKEKGTSKQIQHFL